jgi:hypothetical protein
MVVDWCGQAEQRTAAVSMQLEVLLMIEQWHAEYAQQFQVHVSVL